MAYQIILPRSNAFAYQSQLVSAASGLLIYFDTEVHHLARYIGKSLVLSELIRYAADGDAEEGCAGSHGLRNHDGAPLVVSTRWDGHGTLCTSGSLDFASRKVDACLAGYVGCQNNLLQIRPFALGKTGTLNQGNAGIRHAMRHRQTDYAGGRSHIRHLAPEKIARFVATHFAIFCCLALVFLYFKLIILYALRIGKRIVTIHINMRMLVFPEKVISGVPLIVRLIESVAHIIATVAVYLQGSRLVSLVIYDINAHHVAVAETVVVDAGYGKLVDIARELDAVAVVLLGLVAEEVIATACQEHGSYRKQI